MTSVTCSCAGIGGGETNTGVGENTGGGGAGLGTVMTSVVRVSSKTTLPDGVCSIRKRTVREVLIDNSIHLLKRNKKNEINSIEKALTFRLVIFTQFDDFVDIFSSESFLDNNGITLEPY
jgi:hypothetical protein